MRRAFRNRATRILGQIGHAGLSTAWIGAWAVATLGAGAHAATIQTMSPQGEVAKVRQARVTFSASMVKFGDPRLPSPMQVSCKGDKPIAGTGRWIDDKTWVYDFTQDVPAGTRCTLALAPGVRALDGEGITGQTRHDFSTGGPAIVRAYPSPGEHGKIEEEQVFALLLNGAATAASIQKHAYCEVGGVSERLPASVVAGQVRTDIIKAVGLVAQQERVVTVRCARPLPPEAKVNLVWARGIATPSGVPNSADRRLEYQVRAPFTASFTCERVNARADCLPIRPMRIEFSSPVPRKWAGRIVLKAPDGDHKPRLEQNRGETEERLVEMESGGIRKWLYFFTRKKGEVKIDPDESGVSAVEFKPVFPENAELRIEVPPDLKDDAGRRLGNAGFFPLKTRTAEMPPLAKFPRATFGVLELNAEPTLPVTVRHVEGDLAIKGLQPRGDEAGDVGKPLPAAAKAPAMAPAGTAGKASAPVAMRDLRITDDVAIIQWLAKVKRYDEAHLRGEKVEEELGIRLPPPPPKPKNKRPVKRYGEDETEEAERYSPEDHGLVQTRTVSLLNTQKAAARLTLPSSAKTNPHPFEVIGIPMPQPGFHVVEIESPRLGQSLLDRKAPMYVRTSVLVTNMGVHFKWGAVNSGVWVTTLDTAQPVRDAQVRISDCRGRPVWQGRTGKNGFALVEEDLPPLDWEYCSAGESGNEQGYFVSARKTDDKGRADMAFVWSGWNDGIEAWRFHIQGSSREEPEPTRFHTVFDRTLLRAGQTVSMQHHARAETLKGMRLLQDKELPDEVRIVHEGSGQEFKFPLRWRGQRHAETTFAIPQDAKLGTYQVALHTPGRRYNDFTDTGSFRVEAFRLPVMTGRIIGPKAALVQPKDVPLGLQINYGNGGGASGLPVRVSAQLNDADVDTALRTSRFPGFTFRPPREPRDPNAASFFSEAYVDEDDDETFTHARDPRAKLVADKLAVTLDAKGAGNVRLDKLPEVSTPRQLLVQATYADPNGEVQTLSQTLPVWPAAVVLGVRTDSWVSVKQKVAAQVMVLDTSGKPQAGVDVKLRAVAHHTSSTRKRLVGGFYAYDNQNADEDLGTVCSGTSDARGLVLCEAAMAKPGEIELIAEAKDGAGNLARSAASVWVTRQGEVWFGGDNQDRMDLIPERRDYEAGETAKFQVRSPFRQATALVAIERNGIIETFTVQLNGKDPTVEVPVKAEWAPNVYVSVLAVRGRIREVPWYSFFTWGWRAPVEWWKAWRDEGRQYQEPTAMVDLSRPAFKYGIAEIGVGMKPHTLKVDVKPDKDSYPIRATSQVRVKVSLPDGTAPPAGTEVTLAAVDEALLELMPNDSWDLLKAMIQQRGYGIETATAQMQIIGKRHYGKKAVAAGGSGGQFPTRELFDTLLLWNPRVALDAKGEALVKVPLNDSLTGFRIVVVADAVKGRNVALFGSGHGSIRTTQDLQIISGVPPLVREGDQYRAMFTLRNTTAKPMDVALTGSAGAALTTQRIRIEPNAAAEAGWDITVPFNVKEVEWQVQAVAGGEGGAQDRMKFTQKIAEAVPVTVQQATLMQLDRQIAIPIAPPQNALQGGDGALRGGIEVAFKPRLADGLPGVRDFFARYPYTCLEQKASIAIGLRDTGAWQAIASQIPLYLDEDGLANYFPPSAGMQGTGSDSLTAYLLAISDEAAKLGYDFAIPPETRDKMERALIAFVEGHIKREFWMPAFLKNGDLEVRKIAALEALSRTGRVQPRMLGSVQILPNQWPTGAVIDWLMVLDRVKDIPDRDKRIHEAEQVLRARLNVQGTRLGFSTERDDSWWWLMANGDVNSVRMVLGALDKPGWRDDMPRLVTGTLQRQQQGRWSTTVANAWGSVAIEAFSKRFEKDPVTGTSRAGFEPGGQARALNWSAQTAAGGTLALGWPQGFAVGGNKASTTVRVAHEGTGRPWVTFTSRAAVPVTAPFGSGYRITKTITPVDPRIKGAYSRGDVLRVRLDIDVQADATWVVVTDPVPGGATILGSGLGRDSAADTSSEQEDERGWLAYKERSFEAYRAYYRYLPKGRFSVEYTVRLNNPGTFGLPQTRMEAMYAPEMFGESPNASVVVKP